MALFLTYVSSSEQQQPSKTSPENQNKHPTTDSQQPTTDSQQPTTDVPRARAEEDLNASELLRRAYSAGPVSPTCFDV